jgi:cyclic pyranopterin phosphate synthase
MAVQDQFKRPLRDLRLSVIDQCNFRCHYCMPAHIFDENYTFLQNEELLTDDELVRLSVLFSQLGVEKIRITGGEPLLRKGLPFLIERIGKKTGIEDIAVTTNGVFLPKLAQDLREAGVQRVNISLDAIEDDVFRYMNGRGVGISPVLKGINAARKAGLYVKINMVVQKGVNDNQILPMARYFKRLGVTLRFIEYMDVGSTNGWDMSDVMTKKAILTELQSEFSLTPVKEAYFGEVAKRYEYSDKTGEVGFISSVSDTFCGSCTRARVSASGQLYTCLFASKGTDLREKLRSGKSDEELFEYISSVWEKRDDRYSEDRANLKDKREPIEMSYIGG